MKYTRLGASTLKVSRIGLGTMNFGVTSDEAESHRILDAFTDRGGTFIDTANIYSRGNPQGPFHEQGHSEQFIGSWLARTGKREQVVLATKVMLDMGDGHAGLSRTAIRHQVEQSLRRLRTDRIDLYQAHGWDESVSIDETLAAFDELVTEGKIRYFGCSNFSENQIELAYESSARHRLRHFISYQNSFNLVLRNRLRNPMGNFFLDPGDASRYGIGLIAYKTLANGFLAGKFHKDAPIPPESRGSEAVIRNCYNDRCWKLLEAIGAIAHRHGVTVAQVTLAWYSMHAAISTALVGARTAAQISELVGAADLHITDDDFDLIDKLSR